ncbi:MAG: MBL fold metallo-hydrolase [Dehalococcoidales bacterium]|nr:MBL fold metallo-hydrolase [Dehalococcoidales bacterium]
MKKLALPLLALIVILGFAFGCASGYTPAPGPDTSPATTESPTVPATSPATVSPSESPSPSPLQQGELKVHFIDMGQGDATLLQGPDFTILIDAGRHDRSDVVPYLKSAGVKTIDLLIGTHPHADHIGQFSQVIEAFPVGEVWLSGDTTTTRTFERAIDAIEASDAGYHEPRAGETFNFGSARIEVLNPARLTGNLHEGSISVRIVYGSFTMLFTGDAEAETETAILVRQGGVNALILQLGHHGSSTSSSAEFLKAVNPEIAVYSAAEGNSYGHPHEVVLDRLRQMGVQIYGTDVNGTIMVITDGQTYEVQVQRR